MDSMSHRILISDTQVASRRMLRFAMNMKGGEIHECAGVDATVAALAAQCFDLLLVSLYPRDTESNLLLEQLSERVRQEALPVILIGDNVLRADFALHHWRGTTWLDRPFRVSDLLNLADSILSTPAVRPGQGKGRV